MSPSSPAWVSLLSSDPQSQATASRCPRRTANCTNLNFASSPQPCPSSHPPRSAVYLLTRLATSTACLTHPAHSPQPFLKALCFVSETSCTSFLSSRATPTLSRRLLWQSRPFLPNQPPSPSHLTDRAPLPAHYCIPGVVLAPVIDAPPGDKVLIAGPELRLRTQGSGKPSISAKYS